MTQLLFSAYLFDVFGSTWMDPPPHEGVYSTVPEVPLQLCGLPHEGVSTTDAPWTNPPPRNVYLSDVPFTSTDFPKSVHPPNIPSPCMDSSRSLPLPDVPLQVYGLPGMFVFLMSPFTSLYRLPQECASSWCPPRHVWTPEVCLYLMSPSKCMDSTRNVHLPDVPLHMRRFLQKWCASTFSTYMESPQEYVSTWCPLHMWWLPQECVST